MKEILDFWFAEGPDAFRQAWFTKDPAFDAKIAEHFSALLEPARTGALDHWAATPEGTLALLLVLDQFGRNLHRGSAQAFAGDAHSLSVAHRAVLDQRQDLALPPTQRIFLYLPFEHAESLTAQHLSVALFEGLRDHAAHAAPKGTIAFAWAHREVIQHFGRFPHRNAVLGRASTAAELAYLAQPGAGF